MSTDRVAGYPPIGGYAAIGDGRTLALVARDGSIDWMCLPELDSPAVFAAALDAGRGGRFAIEPAIPYEVERRYTDRSNVLETDFRTERGTVRVTDAVTLDTAQDVPWRELVRRVECLGEAPVPVRWHYQPRPEFGRCEARLEREQGALVARHGALQLALQAWDAGEPAIEGGIAAATVEVAPGTPALLALVATDQGPLTLPRRDPVERRLGATAEAWRARIAHHGYDGRWKAAVERSLLALELLADPNTGAIAAAGTTSLPEELGGKRNYDYRFGWVRDAAFAMDALLRLDLEETATRSLGWLLQAEQRTHPRINPVYHLDGSPLKSQGQLPLAGYRATGPVHVGNEAGSQRQLGGWGDFVETISLYVRRGHLLAPEVGARLADCADLLTHLWRNDDAGLWEIEDADYTTSKISCWLVFDRLLALADEGLVAGRGVARWRAAREQVREHVERHLWSEAKRSYRFKAGSDALDAGCLLAARRGFADPRGERMRGTIDAVRRELGAGGPLLYRYSGMQEEENAFLACSFWLVEALALAHRFDEAAELMDELVDLATDVGLYAEEMRPGDRQMRGNIPQALTHLSLLNAAALFEEALAEASRPSPAGASSGAAAG